MKRLASTILILLAASGLASAMEHGPDASYTYSDQATGGRSLVVADVHLPEGGFIAVHDASLLEGNVIGSVVGVSEYVSAGTEGAAGGEVRVTLFRSVEGPNATLIVMPHKDTNENHIYDFISSGGTADGPYTGGPQALSGLEGDQAAFNGIVATPRALNVTASIRAVDQPTNGQSVLVDYVELSESGFIAVHDSSLLGADGSVADVFGSVVGVSAVLEPGIHRNVLVPLDFGGETRNVTGLVIPMAHKDTNGNGQYDFVSTEGREDGPFTGQFDTPLNTVVATPTLTYSGSANTTYRSQATGGRLVVVEEVFLPQGGFIAVHDATLVENADPLGSVRGVSAYLAPGLHRSVPVELNFDGKPALNASQTIYAMPHKDSNNNRAYDFVSSSGQQDPPYTGGPDALSGLEGGLAGFNGISTAAGNATISATVWAAPQQDSDGATLRVAYADLSEPGFIAAHDPSLLANPGEYVLSSVVGISDALPAGLSRDVVIRFGDVAGGTKGALNISQTLILMPHKDSNQNGAYDFVTSGGTDDPPFTTSGAEANTASALDLNIVVGLTRAIVSPPDATTPPGGGTPTPPATPTGTPATPTGTPGPGTTPGGPTPTPEENSSNVPGPGLAALVIVAAVAALAYNRRR